MCLGIVQSITDRSLEGIQQFERALELNRNLAYAHGQIGAAKIRLGRAEDAEAHIQEALRLSPRDPFVYTWSFIGGAAKLHLGKEEEAVAWLRRSVESNRNFPTSHFYLAAALARLGRLSEARSAAKAGLAIIPTFSIARVRAGAASNHPIAVVGYERIIDGLRKAGVPEG
jgi:tetratricopeptide (TPR) repeat protein